MKFWYLFLPALMLLATRADAQVDGLDELWPRTPVQIFDFEDQPLGPIGTGGAALGQPSGFSNIYMLATVTTDADGRRLEIERDRPELSSGVGYVHFNLTDEAAISGVRSEILIRLTPSALDQYQIIFAGPGGDQDFGVIRLRKDGVIEARGSVAAEEIGNYAADEALEFLIEHWLEAGSKHWNMWLNGEQLVEERPYLGALDPGLGRVSVGYWAASDIGPSNGTRMWLDLLEIRHGAADLSVLLDADFDDKTPGSALGNSGPASGEPTATPPAVSTQIVFADGEPLLEGAPPDLALELTREIAGSASGMLEWRFLSEALVQDSFVLIDLDIKVLDGTVFSIRLDAEDGEKLLDLYSTYAVSVGGRIFSRFPDQFGLGTQIGSYGVSDQFRLRVACDMSRRLCSLAVNDDWAIRKRAFAESSSATFAFAALHAGLGFGSVGHRIELDRLSVLAHRPTDLPSHIAFQQQPFVGACGQPLSPTLEVAVRDGRGVLTSAPVTVELSEDSDLLEPGALLAPSAVSVGGVAAFPSATVFQRVEGLRLAAIVDDLFNPLITVSAPIDIGPGAPVDADFLELPVNALVGQPPTPALRLQLEDICAGPAASGTDVVLLVESGPPGGTVEDNSTLIDAEGQAVFDQLRFTHAGTYTLRASVNGALIGDASAPILVSDPPPGSASFFVEPGDTQVNAPIDPAVMVSVLDIFGSPVADGLSVSLIIEDGPSGAAATATESTIVAGHARFPDLSLDRPGSYRLRAQVEGLASAAEPISSFFNILPGAPSTLEFETQPSDVAAGSVISPAVTVRVRDADGFDVADGTTVEIRIEEGPEGASLSGTLIQASSDGRASFDDLMLDLPGSYRLTVETDNGSSASSMEFRQFDDRLFHHGFED